MPAEVATETEIDQSYSAFPEIGLHDKGSYSGAAGGSSSSRAGVIGGGSGGSGGGSGGSGGSSSSSSSARRGWRLSRTATPHAIPHKTDAGPCSAKQEEAQKELFERPLKQYSEVVSYAM